MTASGADPGTPVDVRLAPPHDAKGTLTFASMSPPPPLGLVSVDVVSVDPSEFPSDLTGEATANVDGTFQIADVPNVFRLRFHAPAPWILQRIVWRGRDVTDVPIDAGTADVDGLEAVFTDRPAGLTGVVIDRDHGVAASVILFADDPSLWSYPSRFSRMLRSDQDGRFAVDDLPAGTYLVAAQLQARPDWMSEEVLSDLRRHARRASRSALARGRR